MNPCRDHERAWNERLDARDPASPPTSGHAAACPACRALDARYRALNQAIRALTPAPAPPSGFADRVDPKGLSDALADAGSATWDLAREASGPAARVGRQVIEAAELPGTSPAVALPGVVRPASDVWREVGDRVNAGVRPLEGSARHAFGFLVGAPPDEDDSPAQPAEGA
ncbi:MAG: hypothetical protein LC745_11780 [Planctomycetia bacterium]|nr:hypothetical protein [Planctomycetia bacterium]